MRRRMASMLGALGAAGAVAVACSAPSKGALILAISTDMQAPKDLDVISVFVSTNSTVKFDYLGRVLPDGTVSLPSTLAIVEPDDDKAQVRIRVTGFQNQKARVLRDVLTTVPHQRTALLRMPLNFLDDGSAIGTLPAQDVPGGPNGAPDGTTSFDPTDPTVITSSCDFTVKLTSIAGSCAPAAVDSTPLPSYSDPRVFGDGGTQASPVCFPVDQCLASAAPMAPAMITTAPDGSCSFPISAGETGQSWNCALATTDGTGACFGGATPTQCYVPLESDPGEGFSVQAGQAVVMVPGVCKKLAAGATLYVDKSSCPTKVEASPVCQPTGAASTDGGTDGSPVDASADVTR
jgi:hypothetical protein